MRHLTNVLFLMQRSRIVVDLNRDDGCGARFEGGALEGNRHIWVICEPAAHYYTT